MRSGTFALIVVITQLASPIPVAAEDLHRLDNDTVRVGIDLDKGAAITWLSWADYPDNMVNIADPGRLIQQSYYAGRRLDRTADGQHASWSPWSWNPIQGGGVGSWARVTEFRRDDQSLFAETIPKLWDMPDEEAAARMRQWTSLMPSIPNAVQVKCEFVAQRGENDRWGEVRLNPQEVPACYFTRNFQWVKSYLGDGKWRDESQPPGPPWGKATPPLNVMALFEKDGQGVAVFSPSATQHWNFGPHGRGGSGKPTDGPCMHVAPIDRVMLGPRSIYRYRYWLVVGDQPAISETIDRLLELYADERAELVDP
tara:strand:+ start:371694 stop:372629 length:936 start_codon:yes stop_codon:yes gene_type:complete